jgi:phage FluMu protein Com
LTTNVNVVIFGGVVSVISLGGVVWTILAHRERTDWPELAFIVSAVATCTTWATLARRNTKAYFRFECPRCGRIRTQDTNLFYTRVKCRKCRVVW